MLRDLGTIYIFRGPYRSFVPFVVNSSLPIVITQRQRAKSTYIKDLIDLPERVEGGGFVRKLTVGDRAVLMPAQIAEQIGQSIKLIDSVPASLPHEMVSVRQTPRTEFAEVAAQPVATVMLR